MANFSLIQRRCLRGILLLFYCLISFIIYIGFNPNFFCVIVFVSVPILAISILSLVVFVLMRR